MYSITLPNGNIFHGIIMIEHHGANFIRIRVLQRAQLNAIVAAQGNGVILNHAPQNPLMYNVRFPGYDQNNNLLEVSLRLQG